MTPLDQALARTADTRDDPEHYDSRGRFLYPGDVEDAMPESNPARRLASYLQDAILRLVAPDGRHSAYANMPIYLVKGKPGRHVSPDAYFIPGVPFDPKRRSYRLWETGVAPSVVFEILSRGSKHKDRVKNRRRYEKLGIPEYYWFDPDRSTLVALELHPVTQRYRKRAPDPSGRYYSRALGLEVGVAGDEIGLYQQGQYILPLERQLEEKERQLQEALKRLKRLEEERTDR